MTIRAEIKKRLNRFKYLDSNEDDQPLIDQILVLYSGCKEEFGGKFTDVVTGPWGSSRNSRIETANRLVAIMEAEQLLDKLAPTNSVSTELLPVFSLNEDDKDRMIKLASDIRKIVTASTNFDGPHKVRLLNRIAAMEKEIHKAQGLFDVFLGGLSDFGETAGKFGTDIKPLTDRIREMVGIARKNTKAYDQLEPPEEQKELPHPDDFDDE